MAGDPDSNLSETESTGDARPDAASAPSTRALEAELATQKDRYLRLAADFDNFRKRTSRDTERSAAAQKEAFIRELLPVMDNLNARSVATSLPRRNSFDRAWK